jgi:hypothetical protein
MLVVQLRQSPHRQKALDKDGVCEGQIFLGHHQITDEVMNLGLDRLNDRL